MPATVEKIFNLLKAQGSKEDAIQYFESLSGLKNISSLVHSELKRLTAAP